MIWSEKAFFVLPFLVHVLYGFNAIYVYHKHSCMLANNAIRIITSAACKNWVWKEIKVFFELFYKMCCFSFIPFPPNFDDFFGISVVCQPPVIVVVSLVVVVVVVVVGTVVVVVVVVVVGLSTSALKWKYENMKLKG